MQNLSSRFLKSRRLRERASRRGVNLPACWEKVSFHLRHYYYSNYFYYYNCYCCELLKKPEYSVPQSRFEAHAPAVNRLRSSSRPRPPPRTQLIIIIIQLFLLFSASFCFKVFTVIVAVPGVDRLCLSVLISSAVLSTARGKASP